MRYVRGLTSHDTILFILESGKVMIGFISTVHTVSVITIQLDIFK